jgi:hypothetical protein
MWYARCDYIARLVPPHRFNARLLTAATPDTTPKCLDWMLGTNRFAQEHWAASHPSAVIKDVLPYRTRRGAPVRYLYATHGVPDPASWDPAPSLFPRPGMAVESFLLPRHASYLPCSAVSFRERQYAAAFGPAAAAGAACDPDGLRRAWPGAALRAFRAAPGPVRRSKPAAAFVDDIERLGAY